MARGGGLTGQILVGAGVIGAAGLAYFYFKDKDLSKLFDLKGITDWIDGLLGQKPGPEPEPEPEPAKIKCKDGKMDTQANCDKQAGCKSSEHWDADKKKCVTGAAPKPKPEPKPEPTPGGGGSGSAIFGAAGDWGSGRNSTYTKTCAAMIKAKIQTALGLGDYSYTNTSDAKKIVDCLKKGGIPMKGAEGNHDSSSYASIFTNQSSMLYSFNQGPAVVIILNTEGSASANTAFAEKILKATKQTWKILIMHKPLYTNASNHGAESGLAQALKPIIIKYGVQLVIYAHNHNYQRIYKTDQPKCVFICSGTGGESHYTLKGSLSGTKYMNDNDFGFTKISINGNSLKGQFITTSGAVKDSWSQTATGNVAAYARVYLAQEMEPIGIRISV